MKSYLKLGDWNAVCDVCGFNHKASELKRRWDGMMVCTADFEYRNPQDFIKIPKEHTEVEFTRPVPAYTYVAVTFTRN